MLQVVPLGGLGEFGMNMLALTWGATTIVVDAGVMFPDPELLGVDLDHSGPGVPAATRAAPPRSC